MGRPEYSIYSCRSTRAATASARFGCKVPRRSVHLLDAVVPLVAGAVIALALVKPHTVAPVADAPPAETNLLQEAA
jgi:hypothetical protein